MKKLNLVRWIWLAFTVIPITLSAQSSNHVLTVKKGNYYQLVKMALMPSKDSKQQFDDYFTKLGPVIGESGAKIYSFGVTQPGAGDGPAQMFLIAEYADSTKPDIIFKSQDYLKNRNQRDKALSYISQGFFLATEDGSFDLSQGELRLISLWPKEDKMAQLNAYFDLAVPDAIEKGAAVAPFVFVPDPARTGQSYDAPMVMLAAWQNKINEDSFYKGELFRNNVDKRNNALNFLEEYHIVYFPEQ